MPYRSPGLAKSCEIAGVARFLIGRMPSRSSSALDPTADAGLSYKAEERTARRRCERRDVHTQGATRPAIDSKTCELIFLVH